MKFFLLYAFTIIVGALLTFVVYYNVEKQPYLSRAIDLASFSLAGFGLLGSVFYVENFVERIEHDSSRLTQIRNVGGLINDISDRTAAACDLKKEETPKDEASRGDCKALLDLALSNLHFDYRQLPQFNRVARPVTSPQFQKLADEIDQQIKAVNISNAKFADEEFERALVTKDFSKFGWIYYGGEALCLAFGIGLVRRIVDLQVDWKKKVVRVESQEAPPKT
jgi:hypothetical protein